MTAIESQCTFDEETHIYRIDGQIVPSVTQVLPKSGLEYVSEEALELAAIEGRRNHAILEALVKGENPRCETDHDLEMAYALEDFLRTETPGEIIGAEVMMFSRTKRFAGTADLICSGGIIDLKRSAGDPKIRALQLAGYQILHNERNPVVTHLRPMRWWILTVVDGRYKIRNVYNPLAETVFMGLVRVYHAKVNYQNYMRTV